MEANFVLKAKDLTTDFADGVVKLFSADATLHIKVEYGGSGGSSTSSSSSATAPTGKRRGRKPGFRPTPKVAASTGEAPKKRGRKPGFKVAAAPTAGQPPRKRGRPKRVPTA
jgi:hypothetical protein